MIVDENPQSSSDASSRVPIHFSLSLRKRENFTLRRTLDSHRGKSALSLMTNDWPTCLRGAQVVSFLCSLFPTALCGGSGTWFWPLGSIAGATPAALADTVAVQCAAYDMIAHTWQVFHTTATDQHNGVFLKVMAFTWDVSGDFHPVAEANTGNFTHCRVRLFGRHSAHLGANAAFLRRPTQRKSLVLQRIERITQRRGLNLLLFM